MRLINPKKEQWNAFITANAADGGLLQSWEWGELEKAEGHRAWRLAFEEKGELIACCLLVERRLRFGWTYLYAPRGPIVLGVKCQVSDVVPELEKFAREQGAVFLRVEPPYSMISDLGFSRFHRGSSTPVSPRVLGGAGTESGQISDFKITSSIQPKQTLRIDLTQSEDELLKAMHQKTRYNIGLAGKRGVTIQQMAPTKSRVLDKVGTNCPDSIEDPRLRFHRESSVEPGQSRDKWLRQSRESSTPVSPRVLGGAGTRSGQMAFDVFWTMLTVTTKRDGFRMHSRDHYETILRTLDAELFFAEYDWKPIAAVLVAFFGTTAYYLHGASANEHRDVMAPYALHWSIMREAKRRGCTTYDLWGIDEKKWPGVTRFKKGFAPKRLVTEYLGTFDLPLRPLVYRAYCLFRS